MFCINSACKVLYAKKRMSEKPGFLPVIAFLKLFQVILYLENGKIYNYLQKAGYLELRFNRQRSLCHATKCTTKYDPTLDLHTSGTNITLRNLTQTDQIKLYRTP